jgi:hypothetical protein
MTDQSTSVERPDPPPLEWQPPLCPVCRNATVHHGFPPASGMNTWACEDCGITWRIYSLDDDATGEWMVPDEPQCRSEGKGRDGGVARCVLGENHVDSDSRDTREHKGICSHGHHMEWGRNMWVKEISPSASKEERDARTVERRQRRLEEHQRRNS